MSVTVTVAVCTWNRAASLAVTLAHMRGLRFPAGVTWELLVVDNNSTDGTAAAAEKFAADLPVRVVREPRPGISFARNCAAANARGEYILWTDDDALVEPDWVEQHLNTFAQFNADVVIGKVVPRWAGGEPPWYVPEFNGMYALLDLGGEPRVLTDPDTPGHNVNLGIRRRALDQLGGYREDLGAGRTGGAEDIDLVRRAFAAGLVVAYQPLALVHHVIPAERGTKAFIRKYVRRGTPHHLKLLREAARSVPAVRGLPRYFLRYHVGYAKEWLHATLRGDAGRAFYYELKFRRLMALLRAPPRGRKI